MEAWNTGILSPGFTEIKKMKMYELTIQIFLFNSILQDGSHLCMPCLSKFRLDQTEYPVSLARKFIEGSRRFREISQNKMLGGRA